MVSLPTYTCPACAAKTPLPDAPDDDKFDLWREYPCRKCGKTPDEVGLEALDVLLRELLKATASQWVICSCGCPLSDHVGGFGTTRPLCLRCSKTRNDVSCTFIPTSELNPRYVQ